MLFVVLITGMWQWQALWSFGPSLSRAEDSMAKFGETATHTPKSSKPVSFYEENNKTPASKSGKPPPFYEQNNKTSASKSGEPVSFYEQNIKTPASKSGKPVSFYEQNNKMAFFAQGIYKVRNVAMARVVNNLRPVRVFEFAGSGGFFAREVWRGAPPSLTFYYHSDFTDVALRNVLSMAANATELAGDGPVHVAPGFRVPPLPFRRRVRHFDVEIDRVDVVEWFGTDAHRQQMQPFDVFASISFEHFEDDLGMLARLPRSSMFVFCVPNFDAPAHMRFFADERSIRERYDGDVVRIVDIVTLGSKEFKKETDNKKFIVTARRCRERGCKAED